MCALALLYWYSLLPYFLSFVLFSTHADAELVNETTVETMTVTPGIDWEDDNKLILRARLNLRSGMSQGVYEMLQRWPHHSMRLRVFAYYYQSNPVVVTSINDPGNDFVAVDNESGSEFKLDPIRLPVRANQLVTYHATIKPLRPGALVCIEILRGSLKVYIPGLHTVSFKFRLVWDSRHVVGTYMYLPLEAILHLPISAPFCFNFGCHIKRSFAVPKILLYHRVCSTLSRAGFFGADGQGGGGTRCLPSKNPHLRIYSSKIFLKACPKSSLVKQTWFPWKQWLWFEGGS